MPKKHTSAIVSGMGVALNIVTDLCAKVREAGGTDDDIHRLVTPDGQKILTNMARLVVEARKNDLLVDLDADPFCPNGWTVVGHKKGGKRKFDRNAIGLYLADGQKNGGSMVGNDLRIALADQPVENANQLDWYLDHPDQIPEEWKGRVIFFWGTIYQLPGGELYVRCLYWDGNKWHWSCEWLGSAFSSQHQSAVAGR
jgi:hypothetical protein